MGQKQIAALLLAAMCAAWSGGARSETWHVTGGATAATQSTWVLDGSIAKGWFKGTGEVATPDGEKVSTRLFGSPQRLIESERKSLIHQCIYDITDISQEAALGTVSCNVNDRENRYPWNATIDQSAAEAK